MITVASAAWNQEPEYWMGAQKIPVELAFVQRWMAHPIQSQGQINTGQRGKVRGQHRNISVLAKNLGSCPMALTFWKFGTLEENSFAHLSMRENRGTDLLNIKSLSKWEAQQAQKLQFLNSQPAEINSGFCLEEGVYETQLISNRDPYHFLPRAGLQFVSGLLYCYLALYFLSFWFWRILTVSCANHCRKMKRVCLLKRGWTGGKNLRKFNQ